MNPRFCNDCESFARKYPGGAEVDLAMVFADVRGSTALAETMENTRFAELINRFDGAAARAVIESDGLIEKLLGDQLTALYLPGFCGPAYPRRALQAAIDLLTATGHADASGAWLPVGIGVHVGRAYVGAVGTKDGAVDFTALGDDVNVVARLCGAAEPGEIVVSEAAFQAAEMPALITEEQTIELRGRSKPVNVRLIRQGRHRSADKMP
jgi:adenylate cyclase